MNNKKIIVSGTTLEAVSICDSNCIFKVEILERKGDFVKIKDGNNTKRVKVYKDYEGNEFIYALGKYSMAPIFRAK